MDRVRYCFYKRRGSYLVANFDLERETDTCGYTYEVSLKDIRVAFTGVNTKFPLGYRIPLLKDVVRTLPSHIGLNIEIKTKSLFDLSTAGP